MCCDFVEFYFIFEVVLPSNAHNINFCLFFSFYCQDAGATVSARVWACTDKVLREIRVIFVSWWLIGNR